LQRRLIDGNDEEVVDDDNDDDDAEIPESIEVPITDELDLHHFLPREVADVVTEYIEAAHAAGIRRARIVHGKGTGALRRTVHAALDRHRLVASYQLADERSGQWGATVVELLSESSP
jgi:dsDNA-specific endonuclease/ATPase MutS2